MMTKAFLRNMLTTVVALFSVMISLPATAQSPQAYVVKSADGTTLTFYYDTAKPSRPDGVYDIHATKSDSEGYIYPVWAGTFEDKNTTIAKIVFNSSFKNYRPTTTTNWFAFCSALKQIDGIENLNTSDVTDMSAMFDGCSSLSSVNVSGFDTRNVTNMGEMFAYCSALTTLDLSKFNTEKVTDMYAMFANCTLLATLNCSHFDTRNVTDMAYMFLSCSSLPQLDLSHFNTEKVTNMHSMFYDCEKLSSIDVSGFNTKMVTDMTYMFAACPALTTIYSNSAWECKTSNDMFKKSVKLKGAVAYDDSKVDVAMANPTTGYFSKKVATGIASLPHPSTNTHHSIYNMRGMRMSQSWEALPQGLYIIDGKKVIKK